MSSYQTHAEKLGISIGRAVLEHTQPNRFSFKELCLEYGGPPPLIAGRVIRSSHLSDIQACASIEANFPVGQITVEDGLVCVAEPSS